MNPEPLTGEILAELDWLSKRCRCSRAELIARIVAWQTSQEVKKTTGNITLPVPELPAEVFKLKGEK